MSTDYVEAIYEKAKTHPIEAGVEMVQGLMRWSVTGRLGYGLGSALLSAQEQLNLTDGQMAAVADRVVAPLLKAARQLVDDRKGERVPDEVRDALVEFGENPFTM